MTCSEQLKPTFTLRGHSVGVASIAYCQLPDDRCPCIVSGDDEGSVIVWDLNTYKRVVEYGGNFKSTIQSIKSVELTICDRRTNVLVVQSRNDGVQVWDVCEPSDGTIRSTPNILASFPTYESLFSRGDAVSTEDGRAILAHPSLLENYLTTIRILGVDAKNEASGTADHGKKNDKKHPVFDIVIRSLNSEGRYHLFVAYEDGLINIYKFQLDATQMVPVLKSEGLKVDLVRKIDSNFKEFVSAYDVNQLSTRDAGNYLIVAGSPSKNLCFINCPIYSNDQEPEIHRLRLKSIGVSAISLSSEARLVAVASWDKSVRLYSTTQDHSLVATLDRHTKQVQAILFVPPLSEQSNFLMCCASQDGTISVNLLRSY